MIFRCWLFSTFTNANRVNCSYWLNVSHWTLSNRNELKRNVNLRAVNYVIRTPENKRKFRTSRHWRCRDIERNTKIHMNGTDHQSQIPICRLLWFCNADNVELINITCPHTVKTTGRNIYFFVWYFSRAEIQAIKLICSIITISKCNWLLVSCVAFGLCIAPLICARYHRFVTILAL